MDVAYGLWENLKASLAKLGDAGLFKLDNLLTFSKDLAAPINAEYVTPEGFQTILLARTPDLTHGFICMNAVAFFLEVLGDLFALLLGSGLFSFTFALVWAYVVAYVLYWLVVLAEGNDYQIVAIGLFAIYSIINTVQAVTSLALIIPPIFYLLKTVATLTCAYYAFKIEKNTSGATRLPDTKDDGAELGVAE